jgi:CRP-like cAMP-binding protein
MAESETKNFTPGVRLFKEGDDGDVAYLIKSGKVKITMTGGDGQQKVVGLAGPGSIVGEMALIDN